MSEEHTKELMANHFPICPICKSKADYVLSPSETVVQCNRCNAKFFSHDFMNPQGEFNTLVLFTPPSTLIDESLRTQYKTLEFKELPIAFWKDIGALNVNATIQKSQLDELIVKHELEKPEDVSAKLLSTALPKLLDSCPVCGAKMHVGGLHMVSSSGRSLVKVIAVWWGYWNKEKAKIGYDRIGAGFFSVDFQGLRCTNCKTLLVYSGQAPVLGLNTLPEIEKVEEAKMRIRQEEERVLELEPFTVNKATTKNKIVEMLASNKDRTFTRAEIEQGLEMSLSKDAGYYLVNLILELVKEGTISKKEEEDRNIHYFVK